jgi:hypothetical protein
MAKLLQCNSCRGIYPDTSDGKTITYFHACPTEIIETYAVCNDKGDIVTPATFKPTPNPRNENLMHNEVKPGESVMVSEGSGVTPVE